MKYDVVILGSGLAGSTLGLILVRKGLSVVIIDRLSHPRFAIGESTLTATSHLWMIMADHFDVPELRYLAGHWHVEKITRACGAKRHLGFLYQRPTEPHCDPEEVYQFLVPDFAKGPDTHLYRQDVDSYMAALAHRSGVALHENTSVIRVETGTTGVSVETSCGKTFEGDFLVDASGHQSFMAKQEGLREAPTRLATHSRVLFTHMTGVKPYDEVVNPAIDVPLPWSHGTLHTPPRL